MKCDKRMFDLLRETFGPDCYDAKARLALGTLPQMLTLNGVELPILRETWYNLGQSSQMLCRCAPCLSSEPLEVIAIKTDVDEPMYGLIALNKGADGCGYHYNPMMVETLVTQG